MAVGEPDPASEAGNEPVMLAGAGSGLRTCCRCNGGQQIQTRDVIVLRLSQERRPVLPGRFTLDYFTPSRSTSKISVAFGGITPPAPRAP